MNFARPALLYINILVYYSTFIKFLFTNTLDWIMKLLYFGLLLAPVALAGHWSACVVPGGERRDDKTKECCKSTRVAPDTNGYWHFDSNYHDCRGDGAKSNGLDSGEFAACCSRNNLGSVVG